MKAVLFDLDDTLYPEIEFVKSGFRVVARYLGSRYHFDEDLLFSQMLDTLQREGRGKVFDELLHKLGHYSEEKVKLLVYLYRSHCPTIHLYEDVLPTIEQLRQSGFRLGILTDGMASVQKNKAMALSVESLFDIVIYTDELGRECWKPSTISYMVALDLLQVSPSQAVYIGDDPSKDFIGPNSMGILTIQIHRKMERESMTDIAPKSDRAQFHVEKLEEIWPLVTGERNAS